MPIRIFVRLPRGDTVEVSEHTFTRSRIVVGRTPDCDMVLPGDEVRVSRKHVEIERSDDGYRLVDLGSRNGTLLNKNRIEPNSKHKLAESDVIKMGNVELEIAAINPGKAEHEQAAQIRKPKHTDRREASEFVRPSDLREKTALAVLEEISRHFEGNPRLQSVKDVTEFGERVRTALADLQTGMQRLLDGIVTDLNPMEIEATALRNATLIGRMNKSGLIWQEYLETYSRVLAESARLVEEFNTADLRREGTTPDEIRDKAAAAQKKADESADEIAAPADESNSI